MTLSTAVVFSLALGSYLVWHGQMTIGALTSFGMYLTQLIWPMFAIGWVLSLAERGKAAWRRIEPMLSEPLTIHDEGTFDAQAPEEIAAHALDFSYSGQKGLALNQVSFTLTAGQTLGLVGPTGAGKSTVLRLLLRQYELQSGEIAWNGQPLDAYRLTSLRDAISWVPQESFLFSATISENIALSKPDASRAEIEHVAKLAAVHDDIMRFPYGYDTPVGEKGMTLSGGQRQRVAIARALLADRPLLLLDDALSAVDTATEARILSHLRQERQGRTVVVVSHRLSAVADADRIIVLQAGKITEAGQHTTLLAEDGWYASQWRYQQLEASLDAL
jgi:ATP-binding cassette subfamily B multidrug efflux pump